MELPRIGGNAADRREHGGYDQNSNADNMMMYTVDASISPVMKRRMNTGESNLRCMKYKHDHDELDDHEHEQRGNCRAAEIEEVGQHLDGREQPEDQRDDDVLLVAGVRVPGGVVVVIGVGRLVADCFGAHDAAWIR